MPKAPRARRERPKSRGLDGPPVDKMIDESDAITRTNDEPNDISEPTTTDGRRHPRFDKPRSV